MTASVLMALALGLSIILALSAWTAGRVLERFSRDPGLRERFWTSALYVTLSPLLLTALALAVPPPVRRMTVETAATAMSATVQTASLDGAAWALEPGLAAQGVLAVAALACAARLFRLILRARRLRRLVAEAPPAPAAVATRVADAARASGVRTPEVRMGAEPGPPLLTGLIRPVLILTPGMTLEGAEARVLLHELAHLKRGDHRIVWIEETALSLLAFNPMAALIRRRLGAAREEACDASALAGADLGARRAYARHLVAALRRPDSAPSTVLALTFADTPKEFAMTRLKAVLEPAAAAPRPIRLAALGAGVVLAATAAGAALAAAAARPAEIQWETPPEARVEEAAARYDGLDGAGLQRACAGGDAMDDGFCAGVVFGVALNEPAVCAPDPDDHAALAAEGRRLILAATPAAGEAARAFAGRILARAWPCAASTAPTRFLMDGAPLPEGVDLRAIPPETIRSVEVRTRGEDAPTVEIITRAAPTD